MDKWILFKAKLQLQHKVIRDQQEEKEAKEAEDLEMETEFLKMTLMMMTMIRKETEMEMVKEEAEMEIVNEVVKMDNQVCQ